MLNLVKCFRKAVGCLIVYINLFDNDVAGRQFLLDISEASVDILRSAIGRGFRTVSNINSRLVVLINSN